MNNEITKRDYLFAKAVLAGASAFEAIEAVSSVAIEHPEWDMKESKTWNEWENKP